MRKPIYNALPMMLGMMMAQGEQSDMYAPFTELGFGSRTVEQDLYQRKPFESKAKLKKRQGKRKPRSKRK